MLEADEVTHLRANEMLREFLDTCLAAIFFIADYISVSHYRSSAF